MIRAVFFDIDNTLYSHTQKRIPPSAWQALRELREQGILLFIATGRHYDEMFSLDEDWPFFDGFVTLNGTLNYDRDGQVISAFPITGKARENIVSIFNSRRMPLLVVEKDGMYTNFLNESALHAQATIGMPVPLVRAIGDADIFQLIFYASADQQDAIVAQLPGCTGSRWNDYAFDVIRADAGKDKGIATMLEKHGILPDECLVFGDGDNDVSMLAAFSNSVAMGNACQRAKEVAGHITEDIDEDGIRLALEHFRLL